MNLAEYRASTRPDSVGRRGARRALSVLRSVDFILCTEVLEHIPAATLPTVCPELERVSSGAILIGVPYEQDLRFGRTTCRSRGGRTHPDRLERLFPRFGVRATSFVGQQGPA